GRQARGVRERDPVEVDGDRARLGVEHLEDASHKPFGSGVGESARKRDDGPCTLVSRLDTEQLGVRGLYVVRHPIPCHTQRETPHTALLPRRLLQTYSCTWVVGGAAASSTPGRNPTPNPTRGPA